MTETKNAIIRVARIFIEDHGLLTAYLDLDYGGISQGFGGYDLYPKGCNGNFAGLFIRRCLDTVGVNDWNSLVGKTIRVKSERIKVHEIGHIVKDIWFNPSIEFEQLEKEGKNGG